MSAQHKMSIEAAKNFIFGGNAIITLKNSETAERRTYKIRQPKKNKGSDKPLYWVSVFTGSDNTSDYTFAGTTYPNGVYKHSAKSTFAPNSADIRGFEYLLMSILRGAIDPRMEIWHEGRCGCCGRLLTVPESIESGIGPECAKRRNRR